MISLLRRWYLRHFSQPGTIEFALVLFSAFILVYYFMWLVGPLVVALCLAFCLDWPVEALQKRLKIKRHLASIIVMIAFCSCVIFITVLIVPNVIKQGAEFYNSIVSFGLENTNTEQVSTSKPNAPLSSGPNGQGTAETGSSNGSTGITSNSNSAGAFDLGSSITAAQRLYQLNTVSGVAQGTLATSANAKIARLTEFKQEQAQNQSLTAATAAAAASASATPADATATAAAEVGALPAPESLVPTSAPASGFSASQILDNLTSNAAELSLGSTRESTTALALSEKQRAESANLMGFGARDLSTMSAGQFVGDPRTFTPGFNMPLNTELLELNPSGGDGTFTLTVTDFDLRIAHELYDIVVKLPEPLPSMVTMSMLEGLVEQGRVTATKEIADLMRTYLMPSVFNAFTWLIYLIIVPIFTFLMLYDKKALQTRARLFLLPNNQVLMKEFWPSLHRQIAGYIRGKILHIIIITFANTLAFMIMGVNYAMLLGVGVGLSVVIPYVGAVIIAVPVVLVAIFQFGFSSSLLWVLVIYTAIQLLDSNVLTPMLFSKAMNLDAFSILAAILIFGNLWGFWGVFFAIPLATFIKTLLVRWPNADLPPPAPAPASTSTAVAATAAAGAADTASASTNSTDVSPAESTSTNESAPAATQESSSLTSNNPKA